MALLVGVDQQNDRTFGLSNPPSVIHDRAFENLPIDTSSWPDDRAGVEVDLSMGPHVVSALVETLMVTRGPRRRD